MSLRSQWLNITVEQCHCTQWNCWLYLPTSDVDSFTKYGGQFGVWIMLHSPNAWDFPSISRTAKKEQQKKNSKIKRTNARDVGNRFCMCVIRRNWIWYYNIHFLSQYVDVLFQLLCAYKHRENDEKRRANDIYDYSMRLVEQLRWIETIVEIVASTLLILIVVFLVCINKYH